MNVVHENKRISKRQTPKSLNKEGDLKHHPEFVVQRHKARSLHYDFRLEIGGVLKSWAVPKGPSMNPADKRLAIMVEDHALEYSGFEGVIPTGSYGAGVVEIWDSGSFTPVENKSVSDALTLIDDLRRGVIKFILHGRKLKGEFSLIKMKHGPSNAWLLIKHKDEYAIDETYNIELISDSFDSKKWTSAWRRGSVKS